MKRKFDVADKGLTAHSCMKLIALRRGVHSLMADMMINSFIHMHSDEFILQMIDGIMDSVYKHAKLAGGDTMT